MRCHAGVEPLTLRAPVLRCSRFDDARIPSRWDMEKIAWTLRTSKSGAAIGFAPPKKDE